MTHEPLLPSNQTPLEAALARVMRPSVDPEILRTLWDADRCPTAWLPWLAWALAVDGWELAESEDARRALVKGSMALHRKKGDAVGGAGGDSAARLREVTIIEGRSGRRRNGSFVRNGDQLHGKASAWAEYIVKLGVPITRDQADKLWQAIERYAPARSKLAALDYAAVPIRHNGVAHRDGQYTRGSITT